MKILMVCLGNICRSPMADGLLRKKIKEMNFKIEVDSAGTSGLHSGEAPDFRMRLTAKEMGTPIDSLRARKFVVEDFDRFDAIFAMDKSNLSNILQLARTDVDKQKVHLILNMSHLGKDLEVPDPYYGGEQGFTDVYNMLDEATECIVQKIKNKELI
jgi:protein-tyrosine phosphatase